MTIGIIGTGYVGLVTSVGFAHLGHYVIGVDNQREVVERLRKGISTIYEEDIEELLVKEKESLYFTTDYADLVQCEVVFIAVGTPSLPNGHADLSYVFTAIDKLISIVSKDTVIAVRSTIPVGSMKKIRDYLTEKNVFHRLGFCPEFLKEGVAMSDFLFPQRVVIASDSEEGFESLKKVYAPLIESKNIPLVQCDTFETAELIKYASNSFLATKIAFINQIAEFAQSANANIHTITKAMGLDIRISSHFLQAGPGYGGSCFPKDVLALTKCGLEHGIHLSLIEETHRANLSHQNFVVSWILEQLEKNGMYEMKENIVIAIWGLTFKANTDDVRESVSIQIVKTMIEKGFTVKVYDPKGKENFIKCIDHNNIVVSSNAQEAIKDAIALVVLTEWEEFASIPVESVCATIKSLNGIKHIFDTRNILNADEYKRAGGTVFSLGVMPSS